MNITDCTFSEKDGTDPSKKGIRSQQNSLSALERELSRNGVLSVAKAGGAHLADMMRENLERFGGARKRYRAHTFGVVPRLQDEKVSFAKAGNSPFAVCSWVSM
jgi:hypothetical protein